MAINHKNNTKDWFYLIPKVELHVHIEGAIPLSTLWQLVQKYGGDKEVKSEAELRDKFTFVDFPHFIDTWVWKNQFIREYDDFTLIAEAFAREQLRQNIIYTEAFYSPPDFARQGLKTQEITAAIRQGLDRVPEVEITLVTDLVRDFGPEQGGRTLREVAEVRDLGVIGIGIGGSEQDYPPEAFEQVYEDARKLGFHTSAHAGEAAGADSIWNAVKVLQADRIGHGTRACEDPRLVAYLKEQAIPLEVCPTSNICAGIVDSYQVHPVKDYWSAGLNISINTDDPVMFDISLSQEYRKLALELGFTRNDIRVLIMQAIDCSWLSASKKAEYQRIFRNSPEWQE